MENELLILLEKMFTILLRPSMLSFTSAVGFRKTHHIESSIKHINIEKLNIIFNIDAKNIFITL